MKKFKILFIFLFVLVPSVVKADKDTIYSPTCIPNTFVRIEMGDIILDNQICYVRRGSDSKIMFQLNSWFMSDADIILSPIQEPPEGINLDLIDYKYIERYASFGYDYFDNSNNSMWYAATQLLIWQRVNKNADIYFINYKTGEKIDNYNEIVDQIRDYVDKQLVIPSVSLSNQQVNLGEKLVLKEKDSDLNNFYISTNNENIHIVKENNELVIKGIKKGPSVINLTLTPTSLDNNDSVFYKDHGKRIYLTKGKPATISYNINVEVTAGNIVFDSSDLTTNNKLIDLNKISYGIYDEEKKLIETVKLINDKEITSKDLPYGNYLLKQLTSSDNYKLDDNYYKINLDKTEIDFKVKLGHEIPLEGEKENLGGKLIEEIIEVPNTLSRDLSKNIIFLIYPMFLLINKRKIYEI